eukprot:m.71578 g.71578  ORF g.71578 m.71578 type:complete len:361 (+) comp8355_c0_seq3:125-1207(+)
MSLVPVENGNQLNVGEQQQQEQQHQQQQQEQQPVVEGDHEERYATTLQGILNFAISQTDGSTPVDPEQVTSMDEERKKFLAEFLENMQGRDHMTTVKNALSIILDETKDEGEKLYQMEIIAEEVEDLNIAEDFITMNGIASIKALLYSTNPEFQWRAATIVAHMTQNNPKCQSAAANHNLVEVVLPLVEGERKDVVRVKAIHALSCMVRGSKDLLLQMLSQENALPSILSCLEGSESSSRLKVKTLVFLKHLLRESLKLNDNLVEGLSPAQLPKECLVSKSSISAITSVLSSNMDDQQLWEHGMILLCELKKIGSETFDGMLRTGAMPFSKIALSRRETLNGEDRDLHLEELESHKILFE